MKKFLIAVICIIPIVVVLALSVTSNIILLTTPVNPESIVVKNSRNEVIGQGELITVDKDTEDFLIVEIYPNITPDKSIIQERDPGAGDGEVELVPIEGTNRYRIHALSMGATDLIIRAAKNINVVFTLSFYVTTTEIDSICIYNGEGAPINENEVYDLKTAEQFYYDINPMAALHESNVEWISGNSEIIKVSVNGTVTPVSKGVTWLVLSATDREGNNHRAQIYVDTSMAVLKNPTVYVSDDSADVESLLLANVVTGVGVSVEKTERISDDLYSMDIYYDGELTTVEVGVIYCGEDEWGFTDTLETIYTQNGPYYATFGYFITTEPITDEALTLVSDNPDVLSVERVSFASVGAGFELKPHKAGVATLSAVYNGKTVVKQITVRERPVAFSLELTTADAQRGIQLDRVWGTEWLDENNNITNVFRLGIVGDNNSFDVRWSVSTEGLAEGAVSPVGVAKEEGLQTAVITVDPTAALGKTVTVTATLMVNNRPVEVARSFTFKFHDLPSVNVYDFQDALSVIDIGNRDIIMQNDLYATNDVRNKAMRSSIYGNGFLFDFSAHRPYESQSTDFVFSIDNGTHFAEGKDYGNGVYDEGFVFEEIVMRGAETLEDAEKTSQLVRARDVRNSKLTYRYCQIYNTTRGIQTQGVADITIEGCILGDNYSSSLEFGYNPSQAKNCSVTLRNNVLKATYGASIQIIPRYVDSASLNKNIIPNFKVEGFMDVYNWKKRSEVKDILTTTLFTLVGENYISGTLRDTLKKALATVMDEVANDPSFEHLVYSSGGEEYVSIAGVGLGIMCSLDLTGVEIPKESGVSSQFVYFRDENGELLPALKGVQTLLNLFNVEGLSIDNDCFLICSDFSSGAPAIEPGDQIPNDRALYDRLTGKTP